VKWYGHEGPRVGYHGVETSEDGDVLSIAQDMQWHTRWLIRLYISCISAIVHNVE
jgi:hypothetical protein